MEISHKEDDFTGGYILLDEILMSTENLVTLVICCKFKKNLFEV